MGPMFFGTYLITLHRYVQRIKCGMGLNAIFYRTSVQLGKKTKGFIHYPLGKLKIFALGSSIYSSSHGTWVNFLTVFNAIVQFSSIPTYLPYLGEVLPSYPTSSDFHPLCNNFHECHYTFRIFIYFHIFLICLHM
jgi:hypothetical protein